MEIWKPVKGYEGLYEVSNAGRIKSVCAGRWKTTIIRKLVVDKDGYLTVNLKSNGKYRCLKVHRIVAEAFISNPDKLPQVNHIDENKQNNAVSNLEWCTCKYNNNFNDRPKRFMKPVEQLTVDGEIIKRFDSVNDAARSIGVNPASISGVLSGRRVKTGGYKWRYAL